MTSPASSIEEINGYFKNRMAESKKIWASRGKEAHQAAVQKRAIEGKSWRQLRGMSLFFHEMKHVGNRPFAWGFFGVALTSIWIQTKFSDDMKAGSEYWQTFHSTGDKKAGH